MLWTRTPGYARPAYNILIRRYNHTSYELKYAEKLQQRARAEGVSLEELKLKVKEAAIANAKKPPLPINHGCVGERNSAQSLPSAVQRERRDSSPVKSLSSILNISRIFATPHTPEQVSALWTAYHMSRSDGTGRGFVCASIPLEMYKKMVETATKYPTFVVPLPRPGTTVEAERNSENDTSHEFYYLQWDFHYKPPSPTATNDPFTSLKSSTNYPISTILFTPLLEYRTHLTFATPFLALTHYTDLAETHGIVLLRGEITPKTGSSNDMKYMLTQNDAQLLSMAVQKFYLWDADDEQVTESGLLLKQFHEESQQFKWEDLLKRSSFDI